MVARYVIPEVNGLLKDLRESYKYVTQNRGMWDRAREAVRSKIQENSRASEAMALDDARKMTIPNKEPEQKKD
jgi:limonene 1,2-monooxygenase